MPDKTYSHRDFTGHDLTDRKDMSGIEIENSCFSHEQPDSVVFPADMTGTTFIDCNLDNCLIPPGNTVKGGTQRRFAVQTDNEDWVVDDKGFAVEPVNLKQFQVLKLSTDPANLPAEKAGDQPITTAKILAINAAKQDVLDAAAVKFDADLASGAIDPLPVLTVDPLLAGGIG